MTQETKVKLVIEITHAEQLEIENICTEKNKSFTDYFMGLHREDQKLLKDIQTEICMPKKELIEQKKALAKKTDFKQKSIDRK